MARWQTAGRWRFWVLALLWLPAGILAQAAVRFAPEVWLSALLEGAGWLAFAAPCGLPLALGCRWMARLGHRRAAWTAGTVLGAVTVAVSLAAGLLGPVAIAACAAVLAIPAWAGSWWVARRA